MHVASVRLGRERGSGQKGPELDGRGRLLGVLGQTAGERRDQHGSGGVREHPEHDDQHQERGQRGAAEAGDERPGAAPADGHSGEQPAGSRAGGWAARFGGER